MSADGLPVLIQELEGAFTYLELGAAKLPEQGVEVGVKLRHVVNRYPGATTPSVQIMGIEEDPIILRGRIVDAQTGLSGDALATMGLLRSQLLGLRYCSLSWGTDLVRRGFVIGAKLTLRKATSIDYELTFLPVEADEASVLAVPFPNAVSPLSLLDLLREILAALDDLADTLVALNNLGRGLL